VYAPLVPPDGSGQISLQGPRPACQ
jgi:hypothetical protein